MKKEERDNIKVVITERFINALDYLVDSGKISSIKDFERITGIRSQRITGMRTFLKDETETKPYYVTTDHIAIIHQFFGVSFEYLFLGERPIVKYAIKPTSESDIVSEPVQHYETKVVMQLKEEIELLKSKVGILKDRFELFVEKQMERPKF